MPPRPVCWRTGWPRGRRGGPANRPPRGPAGRSWGSAHPGWWRQRHCSGRGGRAGPGVGDRLAPQDPTHPTSATTRRWGTRSGCGRGPNHGWSTARRCGRTDGEPGRDPVGPSLHRLPAPRGDGRSTAGAYVGAGAPCQARAAELARSCCRRGPEGVHWETRACPKTERAQTEREGQLVGVRARAHRDRDGALARESGKPRGSRAIATIVNKTVAP